MKLPRFSIDDETRRTIDETKNKALLQADRALRATDRLLQPRLVVSLFLAVLVLLLLASGVVIIKEHRRIYAVAALYIALLRLERTCRGISGQNADAGAYFNNPAFTVNSAHIRHFRADIRVDDKILPERF